MKLNDRSNLTAKLNRLIERDADSRKQFLALFATNPAQAIHRRGESVAMFAHAADYAAHCLKQLAAVVAEDPTGFDKWAADTVHWFSNCMIDSLDAHRDSREHRNEAEAAKLVWEAFTRYL